MRMAYFASILSLSPSFIVEGKRKAGSFHLNEQESSARTSNPRNVAEILRNVDILSQDFCIGSVSLVFPISQMQQDVGGNLLREQVESLTSNLGQTARQAILNKTANEFIGQLKKSDLKNS